MPDYKDRQAKYRELSKPKFHPKGIKVTFTKHHGRRFKDEERELPNALGSHMIHIGGGFVTVNRQEARRHNA